MFIRLFVFIHFYFILLDWKSEIQDSRPNYISLASRRAKQTTIDSETFNLTNVKAIMNSKTSKIISPTSNKTRISFDNLFISNQRNK